MYILVDNLFVRALELKPFYGSVFEACSERDKSVQLKSVLSGGRGEVIPSLSIFSLHILESIKAFPSILPINHVFSNGITSNERTHFDL